MTPPNDPSSPLADVSCAPQLQLFALTGVPLIEAGDDLVTLAADALGRASLHLADGDVLVVTSKALSRAQGRFVDLATVTPSERACELAVRVAKDPRAVELILRESVSVSRVIPSGSMVVRHRLGFVCSNAGLDFSNAAPSGAAAGSGPWALLLPEAPDVEAERIRAALSQRANAAIGVVVTDSFSRPFRLGTVGAAIGVAGVPSLWDHRGRRDLFGRPLETTVTALGDQIAAAADLVAGQSDEGRPFVLVRGLTFRVGAHSAEQLQRRAEEDVYA